MALYFSPIANDQQMDANGDPLVGGKIYTYLAGSTTPAATYTDSTGGTPQANPIILNSLGLSASPIWLTGGVSYKFVIKDSADVTLRTVDGIMGINDVSSTAQEWNESGLVPTYISATQFSVAGDQTSLLQVNRRLRCDVTAGFVYGRISVSAFAAGITTVTMVNDSTPLDSGLSSVAYGFLSFSPSSVPYALYAAAGANTDITSLQRTALPSLIQSLPDPTLAANAMTLPASTHALDFRSTTLSSGLPTTVTGTAAALVIPSGATLGTVSGQQSTLIEVIINNSGTLEKAIVNISGGSDLSETGVINTTAISGAANSASVFYSTTARTGVAYRVVRSITSTQATAGTWVTTPSLVQGAGGNALTSMSGLGYGQTVQNLSGSRSLSTTYYNTTGRPIFLSVGSTTGNIGITLTVNGVSQGQRTDACDAVIPPGNSYSVAFSAGGISVWSETRM